jgi:hypothetical protein
MKPNVLDLIVPAQEVFKVFDAAMMTAGLLYKVTCIKRTTEEQIALYAQGRQNLSVVNELRRVAGLYELTDKENKRPVTWTLKSRHLPLDASNPIVKKYPVFLGKCLAWDIVIKKDFKNVTWDLKADIDKDDIPDYEEAARVGEKLGLIVGARWPKNKRDWPHFEYDVNRYFK